MLRLHKVMTPAALKFNPREKLKHGTLRKKHIGPEARRENNTNPVKIF